jgi:hypothetical protein
VHIFFSLDKSLKTLKCNDVMIRDKQMSRYGLLNIMVKHDRQFNARRKAAHLMTF